MVALDLEAALKPRLRPANFRWKVSQNAHMFHICVASETLFILLSGLIQSFNTTS